MQVLGAVVLWDHQSEGCVFTSEPSGKPHRGPAKAHGVVEEQEENGGSERVLELSEGRANEVFNTASESSVRALQECKLTSISCTSSTLDPTIGDPVGRV